ncbi:hypothetical protein FRC10_001214 [Ceratobasidium sp. 414]|nr:hypothetical protein FRC10_001214 [Ceratobasidium sp. 414]
MAPANHVWTEPASGVAPKPRQYKPEQQAMIDELRQYAKTIMLPESDPYHEHERHWLLDDPECCGRYMRAAKWRLDDGKKRIKGTLEWRREFKPDLIPPEEVRIESESGKIILNGFDVDGRPILYMRPGRENTETSPRQIRHLIFCLERAIDFMPPNQDSMVIIVDYKSTTLRTNPSISVARKVLHILQQHYVERLGRAIVVNLPVLLNFFYKGISPFLDPVTRDKMRFNPNLPELVPVSQLDKDLGGEFPFEFEPVSYWEQIISYVHLVDVRLIPALIQSIDIASLIPTVHTGGSQRRQKMLKRGAASTSTASPELSTSSSSRVSMEEPPAVTSGPEAVVQIAGEDTTRHELAERDTK